MTAPVCLVTITRVNHPIPSRTRQVKPLSADDSVAVCHVKVGNCQALKHNPILSYDRMGFFMPVKKEKIMSYSDYQTLKELTKKLVITYQVANLFPYIQEVAPSAFLLHSLEVAKMLPSTFSEKSRSENLITPILFDVYEQRQQFITIFSGCSLNINEQLSGICDYIVARKGEKFQNRYILQTLLINHVKQNKSTR